MSVCITCMTLGLCVQLFSHDAHIGNRIHVDETYRASILGVTCVLRVLCVNMKHT